MQNQTVEEKASTTAPAVKPKKHFSFAVYWLISIFGLLSAWAIMLGIKIYNGSQNEVFHGVIFVTAVIAVLDLVAYIWWHKTKKSPGAITIHAYPDFVYIWPLIVAGVIFYYLGETVNPALTGWIYVTLAAVVFLTIGYDLNRNYSVFWALVIGFIWVLCLWLRSAKGVMYFEEVGNTIKEFPMEYSPSLGWALSVALALGYSIMLVEVRLNQRWRITRNEIEHKSFGFADDSLARGAKRVMATYPDIFELILLGSGTLTIYSAQGGNKLREIRNIPFLVFRMKKISQILETMAVTPEEIEIEDTGEHEEGHNG